MYMHPLLAALELAGLTQGQLSAGIAALGWVRRDGKPLRLTQSAISEIGSWKRRTTPQQAEACVAVLRPCGATITAAEIVFAKRPEEQHTVGKPKKTKPRHRAA
jgi:hypothetical protein